jgi:hypothetical protein
LIQNKIHINQVPEDVKRQMRERCENVHKPAVTDGVKQYWNPEEISKI